MEALETLLCNVVQFFQSWLPQRVETQVMSRDFWMPDQSCRVCYDCDIPFSLFNRRHHCRICGRVFCGKCTQNTLPVTDNQSGKHYENVRVRTCNFCFRLKQEERKQEAGRNVVKPLTPPTLTPSSSNFSLSSSGTNTSGSSTSALSSARNSNQSFFYKALPSDSIEPIAERRPQKSTSSGRRGIRSSSPRGRESSPNPYDFCSNRSEDEDTDHKDHFSEAKRAFHPQSREEEEDSCTEMDVAKTPPDQVASNFMRSITARTDNVEIANDKIRLEDVSLRAENTPVVERSLSRRSIFSSDDYEGPEESLNESNFYTPSLVHASATITDEEHVDVENNESIWVPPPPEDEDDDMAMTLAREYDSDDEDEQSGWGSHTSSEYRLREKPTALQEQRRAMQAVVDGHFRALVGQLLDSEGLDGDEFKKDSWLEIVASVASQAASFLKPDSLQDGSMDPGTYVKVKCIASGQRTDRYM